MNNPTPDEKDFDEIIPKGEDRNFISEPNNEPISQCIVKEYGTVYVLLLEENKYYIGFTVSFDTRMIDHFMGDGSKWTTKYKPIKIVEQMDNVHYSTEERVTMRYMEKYGADNVRGGRHTSPKFQYKRLQNLYLLKTQ